MAHERGAGLSGSNCYTQLCAWHSKRGGSARAIPMFSLQEFCRKTVTIFIRLVVCIHTSEATRVIFSSVARTARSR
eukprot:2681350-Rhodomonas_salina.3